MARGEPMRNGRDTGAAPGAHIRGARTVTRPVDSRIISVLEAEIARRQPRGQTPKRRGDETWFLCPGHDDHHPSARWNGTKHVWTCDVCGAGGGAHSLAQKFGIPVAESLPIRRAPERAGARGRRVAATYPYVDEDGALLFEVVRYERKHFRQRRPDGRGGYIWDLKGVTPLIYRLPRVRGAVAQGSTIYVVEGEKDVHTLEDIGVVATCNPGGAGKWRDEFSDDLRGVDVVIVRDRDGAGYRHASAIARSLRGKARSVRIVEAVAGNDTADHVAAGHGIDDFVDVPLREDGPVAAQAPPGAWSAAERSGVSLVRLDAVQAQSVAWLWPGRIALGKLTLLDGDPGQLKSTITLDLAARVTTGRPMPDGASGVTGGVVLLTFEDGLADTICPRLDAARADVSRVVALRGVAADDDVRLPTIPEDLDAISAGIADVGALLVIVDPLMAALSGDVNSHRDQDVRRALAPLARLAEERGVAVLVVRHLNKALAMKALYRGGGSIGISAAARAVLLAADAPDAEGEHVLAVVKSNLAALAPSLRYRAIEDDNGAIAVEWCGTSDHRADTLLGVPASAEEQSTVDEAADVLRTILADGPVSATDVRKQTREAGIADRTLDRAKRHLSVRSQKDSFTGGWQWCLAGHEEAEDRQDHQDRQASENGDLPGPWRSSDDPAVHDGDSPGGATCLGSPPPSQRTCSDCGGSLEVGRKCWACDYALCRDCGERTTSALVVVCRPACRRSPSTPVRA